MQLDSIWSLNQELTFPSYFLASFFNSSVFSLPSLLPIILPLPFLLGLSFPDYPFPPHLPDPAQPFIISPLPSLCIHTALHLTTYPPTCIASHSISALSLHLLFPFPEVWFSKSVFFTNMFLFKESRSLACLVKGEPVSTIPPTGSELFFS